MYRTDASHQIVVNAVLLYFIHIMTCLVNKSEEKENRYNNQKGKKQANIKDVGTRL